MVVFDLLGRRWALRVLWELHAGPLGARTILSRCEGLSPSVLYDRLRELTEAGLVGRRGQDYALTNLGRALGDAIAPLDAWSKRWAKDLGRVPRHAHRG
jgi:DNA-binding HxlR family transcriptional regulator